MISARVLGPEGRGELASIALFATLFGGVAQLGFGQAFVFGHRANPKWNWTGLLLLAGGIVAFAAVALSHVFVAFVKPGYGANADLLPFLALVIALNGFLISSSQIDPALKVHNTVKLLGPFLVVSGYSLAWLFDVMTVQLTLWVQIVAGTLTAIPLLHWIALRVTARREKGSETSSYVETFGMFGRHAIHLHMTVVLGLALNNIDKVYMFLSGSLGNFGLYTVAFTTSRMLGTFQETLSTTLYSRFAGVKGNEGSESVKRAFRFTFVPMLIVALIIGMLGPQILELMFGASFRSAGWIFAILLVECVLGNSSWLLAQHFNVIGKPNLVFMRQAVSAIPVLALVPFIPESYSMVGIASLLLLSSVVRLGMTLFIYKYVLQDRPPSLMPSWSDIESVVALVKRK